MVVMKKFLAISSVALLSSLSILSFESLPKVLAENFRWYTPPSWLSKHIERTQGAGSRGCNNTPIAIDLLTPSDHVPLTTSGRPTFLWYVSKVPPMPMYFTLVKENKPGSILNKEIKVIRPGIAKLELPSEMPELEVGKEYRWTISLVCNQKHPSANVYAYSWIQRVPETPEILHKMKVVSGSDARALIYAKSGIWYDSISTSYRALLADPNNQQTKVHFSQLLDEVGLSTVADQESETH